MQDIVKQWKKLGVWNERLFNLTGIGMEIFSFHQISLSDFLWDFDALSLYAFAMWDEKSTYPKI